MKISNLKIYSFDTYLNNFDKLNFEKNFFDIIVVDGFDRFLSFKKSLDLISKTGIFIFDNSEGYNTITLVEPPSITFQPPPDCKYLINQFFKKVSFSKELVWILDGMKMNNLIIDFLTKWEWIVNGMQLHSKANKMTFLSEWNVIPKRMKCHSKGNEMSFLREWYVIPCSMTCHY